MSRKHLLNSSPVHGPKVGSSRNIYWIALSLGHKLCYFTPTQLLHVQDTGQVDRLSIPGSGGTRFLCLEQVRADNFLICTRSSLGGAPYRGVFVSAHFRTKKTPDYTGTDMFESSKVLKINVRHWVMGTAPTLLPDSAQSIPDSYQLPQVQSDLSLTIRERM